MLPKLVGPQNALDLTLSGRKFTAVEAKEMGLVSNSPRNATVSTLDEVKLLQLKKEDLEELIEEHPVIFKEIEERISSYS